MSVDPIWTMILGGLFLLAFGGDYLVRAAVSVAQHLRVSPLLIGLTLVGFGTSTPELVTSIQAAMIHSPGIAIGNIVGSNIANILLIVGLSSLLAPVAVSFGATWRDGIFVVLTALALTLVSLKGGLTADVGVVFVAALLVYVALAWILEGGHEPDKKAVADAGMGLGVALCVAAAAIGVLIVGAQFLVEGSVKLARTYALSETFIGLTIVAVGTSLPELATSVVAAFRRQGDISVGNILGSNIYNILGVGGVTALIHPIANIPVQIRDFDNFIMIGASVLIFAWLVLRRGIGRLGGLAFLGLYAGYVFLISPGNEDGLAAIQALFKPFADMLHSVNY